MINQSKFKTKIESVVVKNNRIKNKIAKNKEFKEFKDIKDIKKQLKSMNVFHVFQIFFFQIFIAKAFFKASKDITMHKAFFH